MMRYITTLVSVFLIQQMFSQTFINGDFENNSANNTDQINLSNVSLNAMLPGVTAFGSYGDVDIITSSTYGGTGAQHQSWYVAITGGGTDIIALSLSKSLVAGKTYSISFYDRKTNGYAANPIQIGLSTTNTDFGSVIYTSPDAPTDNVWTQRTFTFTAQQHGQYITVQMPGGGISTWAQVDNFVFNNTTVPLKTIISPTVSIVVNDVKKDTVLVNIKHKDSTIVKTIDTTFIKKPFLKFNRRKLNGRKLLIQETVSASKSTIKLMVWDKKRMDGDIVSIYVNGQLIEENLMVSKTKKEIIIQLQPGSNFIVMEAINLGRVPPNTAAISINDGTKHKITTLVSDLKKSGTLEVLFNPDAVAVK
ncbi:MAG: carbohydrate binding domain-containing protein [Chryseobacterium sp.]|nr:carbohydrate binding domain-containing protein [Chryseobacterium sp.]